jgi:hypothetical protein
MSSGSAKAQQRVSSPARAEYTSGLAEAVRMLDAFASVGAHRFDVTFLDIDGGKRGFRPEQSVTQLRHSLPKLLPGLIERRNSLVVRPHGDDVTLVQLDDLDAAALGRLECAAFLTLRTSPGNHQAWVAVSGVAAPDDARDIGRRLRKGTGADLSASGATRVAGTVNYKRKYEPDFPTVTVLSAFPGRMVTVSQLEQFGLLAAPEPVARATPLRVSSSRSWPDYERCVAGAPMNHAKDGPDISRADFLYAKMAADRGHSIEEITARLYEISEKSRSLRCAPNGERDAERYARLTAQNATAASLRQTRSRG